MKLKEEIEQLKRRMKELEDKLNTSAFLPYPIQPSFTIRICPKCNIHLNNVMNYCCDDLKCPIFSKVTC